MDRLTALRVFRNVVELGSFAAAARRLQLSPAAISKNVSELEAHLTVRLLNRTTRRISLTEAGAQYYERIVYLLDELQEADLSLGALQHRPSGTLRVSAPVTLTLTTLSKAIPRFLERNSAVSLDLRMDDRRVNVVEEGFDLAIRASDNLEDSSLVARKLMNLPHVVCGAPSYFDRASAPATPEDLKAHECVRFVLSGHPDAWEFQRGSRKVRVPVSGRYKVTSSLAVIDALRGGFGLSLVPWIYVREDLENGRLRTVLDDWTAVETAVYAIYPSKRHLVPKVRAFIDFLSEELASTAPPEGPDVRHDAV